MHLIRYSIKPSASSCALPRVSKVSQLCSKRQENDVPPFKGSIWCNYSIFLIHQCFPAVKHTGVIYEVSGLSVNSSAVWEELPFFFFPFFCFFTLSLKKVRAVPWTVLCDFTKSTVRLKGHCQYVHQNVVKSGDVLIMTFVRLLHWTQWWKIKMCQLLYVYNLPVRWINSTNGKCTLFSKTRLVYFHSF